MAGLAEKSVNVIQTRPILTLPRGVRTTRTSHLRAYLLSPRGEKVRSPLDEADMEPRQ